MSLCGECGSPFDGSHFGDCKVATGMKSPVPYSCRRWGHVVDGQRCVECGIPRMRADFEAWLREVYGLESEWQEHRNCYKEFPAHLAWLAWQAAKVK